MSMQRRLLVLLLIVVSVALLYPGVTQPVMTLTGTLEKSMVAEEKSAFRVGADILYPADVGVELTVGFSQQGQQIEPRDIEPSFDIPER